MLNRLMGAILMVALASSPIACGTASSKPFDPHDLSGFWDITDSGLPAGALNATSNNRPQMTPAGLEKFRKTKTADATALSNGSSRTKKTGMIRSGGVTRRVFHESCGTPRRGE